MDFFLPRRGGSFPFPKAGAKIGRSFGFARGRREKARRGAGAGVGFGMGVRGLGGVVKKV